MLVCSVCRRVFHPAETSDAIEQMARSKGLFAPIEIEGGNAGNEAQFDYPVYFEIVVSKAPPVVSKEGSQEPALMAQSPVLLPVPQSRAASAAN